MDQMTGKGLPLISMVQRRGKSSSIAIHLPRIAPTKPTPAEIKQPPLPILKPPILWPIPPQIEAINR